MDKVERIQLPPIERGTDSNIVKMLWEYVQLSPEEQEKVGMQFAWVNDTEASSGDEEKVHFVADVDAASFNNAMKDVVADIVLETSQYACWLYHQIYNRGMSVDELLEAYPETGDLTLIMSSVFKQLKEDQDV